MAKNKIAESVPEIIAGEAAGKKKEDWYREMLVASQAKLLAQLPLLRAMAERGGW